MKRFRIRGPRKPCFWCGFLTRWETHGGDPICDDCHEAGRD